VLTSAEGKRLATEKDAEHIAKAQKKKEVERIRKEKEVARDQQRRARHPDEPFVGSLASKKKSRLAGDRRCSEPVRGWHKGCAGSAYQFIFRFKPSST
jgi:hypothetical protein